MLLVDTSVWIDHLRRGDNRLRETLCAGQVLTHPFVIGELACGTLRNRAGILELLQALPQVKTASDAEALVFIEQRRLHGKGLGLIDVHLLAACVLSRTCLWTRDLHLARAAVDLGVAVEMEAP